MKCSNEACHAGFYVKKSIYDGKPAAINHLSYQDIHPIWSDCQKTLGQSLNDILVKIYEHLRRNIETRKERESNKRLQTYDCEVTLMSKCL